MIRDPFSKFRVRGVSGRVGTIGLGRGDSTMVLLPSPDQLLNGQRAGQMRVEMNPEMRRRVDELLGAGNFRLLTAAPNGGPNRRNGNGRYARRT